MSEFGAKRVVQRFTDEYLERCRELSAEDIARFLEEYRISVGAANSSSRTFSLRLPESLLTAFEAQAHASGIPSQEKIRRLMRDWLADPE